MGSWLELKKGWRVWRILEDSAEEGKKGSGRLDMGMEL